MIKGKNIISILDIGSTKITCFIVKRIYADNYEILGVSETASGGVKSGMIVNLEIAKNAIIKSVEVAEKMALVNIKSVFISLNSSFLISERSSADIILSNQEVTVKDLNKLLFKVLGKFSKQEVEIVHTFPYEYILDGNRGISYPLGLYGNKLTGFFHMVSVPVNYTVNISKCLELCQLKIEGYICSGYAAGVACLKSEEMEFGCALIEINGASSTISLFVNDKIIFTDGVPYGGINLAKDIAKVFNLDMKVAEKIKNKHGSMIRSVDDSSAQTIKVDMDVSYEDECFINQNELNDVIIARMHEILTLLKNKLQDNDMMELVSKVIFTGGCAQSIGMKELIEEVFEVKARIGMPNNQEGIPGKFLKSSFSAPIGMLRCIENMNHHKKNLLEDKKGVLKSIWVWLKENF
jgi:cell division protein FtsA